MSWKGFGGFVLVMSGGGKKKEGKKEGKNEWTFWSDCYCNTNKGLVTAMKFPFKTTKKLSKLPGCV